MEDQGIQKQARAFKQLIKVLEEMLFSIPMPIEVIKKYEYMRESSTVKAGIYLPPSKIWALQRTALDRAKNEKKPNDEMIHMTRRLETLESLTSRYQDALQRQLTAFDSVLGRLDGVLSESHYSHLNQRMRFSPMPRAGNSTGLDLEDERLLQQLVDSFTEKESHAALAIDGITAAIKSQEDSIAALESDLAATKARSRDEVETLTSRLEKIQSESISEHAFDAERQVFETEKFNLLKDKERNLEKMSEMQQEIAELKKAQQRGLHAERDSTAREIELLRTEHSAEIEKLKAKYQMEIEDIHQRYRTEMDANDSMNRSHISAIEEVRSEHKLREQELESKLEKVASEDSALLKELRKRLENSQIREQQYKDTLAQIQDRISPIYAKHVSLQKEWTDELRTESRDGLTEVDFLVHLVNKLENDNSWLVERLSDFGKENEFLRAKSDDPEQDQELSPMPKAAASTQPPISPIKSELRSQVLREMKQTSKAMREFEIARSRLMENFERGTNDSFSYTES